MHNIYYSPEKFGLEVVAEIDYSSGSYEYDTRVVWRRLDGVLVTARDAGCSCPTPFESLGLSDLDELTDIAALEQESQEELANKYGYGSSFRATDGPAARQEFLTKVREALR